MGHLHKKGLEDFGHMSGPIAYPGSTERTSSEKIGESKKGFFIVDISGDKAVPEWTEIDTRPQLAFDVGYEDMESRMAEIKELVSGMEPKPVIEVRVSGEIKEPDRVQAHVMRLEEHCLKCVKKLNHRGPDSQEIGKPGEIGEEMLKRAEKSLGSKQYAEFAVKMLLPALESGKIEGAVDIVIKDYDRFKEEYAKSEGSLE